MILASLVKTEKIKGDATIFNIPQELLENKYVIVKANGAAAALTIDD